MPIFFYQILALITEALAISATNANLADAYATHVNWITLTNANDAICTSNAIKYSLCLTLTNDAIARTCYVEKILKEEKSKNNNNNKKKKINKNKVF